MTYSPLVSIITPSYLQGRFIEDTLKSVCHQTYSNIEHIILDSDSPDETDEVVKKYLTLYNLKYIREKDKGQADAINKGLRMARGEIVCWLNSDDYYINKHVIEKVVRLFQDMPDADVVTGAGYYVDEYKKLIMPINIPKPQLITYKYFKTGYHLLQPATFWKKNNIILDENLHYAFDWKFFLDFFKSDKSFFYSNDYYACYRLHEASKTITDNTKRKKELIKILKENQAGKVVLCWNYIMYFLYKVSETLSLPFIKKLAIFMNNLTQKITGWRIGSN